LLTLGKPRALSVTAEPQVPLADDRVFQSQSVIGIGYLRIGC
jgi:hypothetical protein